MLFLCAIGKGRIVGGIDEIGVRPHGGDLTIDRQSPKPGIEDQYGLLRVPAIRLRTISSTLIRITGSRAFGAAR